MSIRYWVAVIASAMLASACGDLETGQLEILSVQVLDADGECVISAKRIPCSRAAAYLKEELQLSNDAVISVNPEKVGDVGQHVKDVAALIKQSGFENVAIVGFVTLPEPNDAPQRTLEDARR